MLAEQVRSGLVETIHDGAVAITDPTGELVASSGDIRRPFYFRSAAKPFQAYVSSRAGANLSRERLALACASHDGEPVHIALVESILAGVGLNEAALGCPPSWPIRLTATRRLANEGATVPRKIWNNCSGKHAAMLAACVSSGWDPDTYLDRHHPLQRAISEFVTNVSGPTDPIGVDGCGAPVFATNCLAMAKSFSFLASAPEMNTIYEAMHSYPALVSGYGNTDAAIATALDAAAKRGAAGCLGIALRNGYGIAIKCWDGNSEAVGVGAVASLEHLGALSETARASLAPVASPETRGGGAPVGRFRSLVELAWE
ncbi:MAG TPA: asparaginase [Acidimicrobiia bacterium]|nr:asparaginase [Acidimicrobiia bacterium]